MTKEEIIDYVYKNDELPDIPQEYFKDQDFINGLLELDTYYIRSFPKDVQKQLIISDDKLAEWADFELIFSDEESIRECIESNPDLLLRIGNCNVKSEYLSDTYNAYIRGEMVPKPGSRLSRGGPIAIYSLAPGYIKENIGLATYLVEQNINNYRRIGLRDIKYNKEYMSKFVAANPREFMEYKDKLEGYFPEYLIESVLKYDFSNYKHFPEDNQIMKQLYSTVEKIRSVRPELTLENQNLRYELLCDENIANMDVNILSSLLEYNTGAVDNIIEASKNGHIKPLEMYIEKYKEIYGATLENIQEAILSYENLKELINNTNGLENINIPYDKLKTVINTGNKFGITSVEELENYDSIVKKYYETSLAKAETIDDVKKLYSEMLFNALPEEMQSFNEEYCNFNRDELYEYAKAHNVETPITEDFKKRIELFEQLECVTDIEELKSKFEYMPMVVSDLNETKQRIAGMYSKTYNQDMLDLSDETLDREIVDGVELIRLNGQNFNICIHRIFNFDFNMNSIANKIIEDPTMWTKIEGSNTISTTLITDKKIAGLFRRMRNKDEAELVMLKDDEAVKSFVENRQAYELSIYEGEALPDIDADAVFYGFTELMNDGIIKMDSTDLMVEHGAGHLKVKTSNCRMRGVEDLAYWTCPTYWNELAQRRREININAADEKRRKNGTDKLMPSCIVCFDENMNENSINAAKTHGIPIVMIDRQQYLDLNTERANKARREFKETLSPDAIREIMYREPYYKVVAEMPALLETIITHDGVMEDKKKLALEYLGYMAEHFVEQSTGNIMGTPVEEYNKTMRKYIEEIDKCRVGTGLVSIEDFEEAYRETTARERKERYESMLKDMKKEQAKEGETIYE